MNFEDLLAPVAGEFDVDEALEAWRWLVPETVKPLVVTAFGDLFLVMPSGAVLFLDTILGKRAEVASSYEEWETELQHLERLDEWFMPVFLNDLRAANKHLERGQCYSALRDISLGGSYTVENFRPTSWRVHFFSSGSLHEQIKDLPPGTKISNIKFTRL